MISGFTDDKGVAYPSVQSFKGIPRGEYIVTVEKINNEFTNDVDHPMNAYLIVGPKYVSATTSTLKLTVDETPINPSSPVLRELARRALAHEPDFLPLIPSP